MQARLRMLSYPEGRRAANNCEGPLMAARVVNGG